MLKIKHKPINVYAITRHGNALTDAGIQAVTDMVLRQPDVPDDVTGALVHTGPDLLDIGHLAALLRADENAEFVISYETEGLILLGRKSDTGTDVEGLLEDALEHGVTSSWEAIATASRLQYE